MSWQEVKTAAKSKVTDVGGQLSTKVEAAKVEAASRKSKTTEVEAEPLPNVAEIYHPPAPLPLV